MKRSLLSFSFMLISMATVAQFHWGLKAGSNVSTLKSKKSHYDMAVGMHIGLIGEIYFNKKFALTSELMISDKGIGNDRVYFRYVMIPVTARYHMNEKIAVEAGFGVGYLAAVYDKFNGNDRNDKNFYWGNDMDFQLASGVYYKLSEKFGVTLRYEFGLSNVIRTHMIVNYIQAPEDPTWADNGTLRARGYDDRNRNLQLSVNYRLSRRR
jgi:hypothetical protein